MYIFGVSPLMFSMKCAKLVTGYVPSLPLPTVSPPPCPANLSTSEANVKLEKQPDTITGSLSPSSAERALSEQCARSLLKMATMKRVAPMRRCGMSGKKKQRCPKPVSNLEPSQSIVPQQPIGTEFGIQPLPDNSSTFQPTFEFVVTHNSLALLQALREALRWNAPAASIVVLLDWESLGSHGTKPGWKLTLRTLDPNGGTVTRVSAMLSSMSFEEISILPIYSDGLIVIQSSWKPKEDPLPSVPNASGLPPISTREVGTQTWIH